MASISFTPMAAAPAQGEKPPKFSGVDLKRWQQKMLVYLTTLGLSRFMKNDPPSTTLNLARLRMEDAPTVGENETDKEKRMAFDAWSQSDFLCRNYILNRLDITLYNVYCSVKTGKELWSSLEKKYKMEDSGTEKFIVGKFLDFKIVDIKTMIGQVQQIQLILHDIIAEGMVLSESFQVAAIIEKLPPLWNDFKNYYKHKRKEMGLKQLIVRLGIEEDNHKSKIKSGKLPIEAKANLVESNASKKRKHPGNGQK
ncbi:hypothetical protein DH2020_015439 [Rehmannia glutinosa]|uniref:Uncharacterized protein n=1 Tax=Rehmannia glutinosa TaxID=99300 RepID=A0ABR0WVX3_REHGL